jgi:hypothetical protein
MAEFEEPRILSIVRLVDGAHPVSKPPYIYPTRAK